MTIFRYLESLDENAARLYASADRRMWPIYSKIDARPIMLYGLMFIGSLVVNWGVLLISTEGRIGDVLLLDNAAYINSYRYWTQGVDVLSDLDYIRGPLAPGLLLWPFAQLWGDITAAWVYNAVAGSAASVIALMFARTVLPEGSPRAVVAALFLVWTPLIFIGSESLSVSAGLLAIMFALRQNHFGVVSALAATTLVGTPPWLAIVSVLAFLASRSHHARIYITVTTLLCLGFHYFLYGSTEYRIMPELGYHILQAAYVGILAAIAITGIRLKLPVWQIALVICFLGSGYGFVRVNYHPIDTMITKAFFIGAWTAPTLLFAVPRSIYKPILATGLFVMMMLHTVLILDAKIGERHDCAAHKVRMVPYQAYDYNTIATIRVQENHTLYTGVNPMMNSAPFIVAKENCLEPRK